jgi:uncharacterized membrane protein YfcA
MSVTLPQGVVLFVAAALAGGLNSVAGGGSFLTFPTLLFTGVPPVSANATSAVALWPGSLASVIAYRREIESFGRLAIVFSIMSLAGGAIGALLLLRTPHTTFVALVPWLMLVATAVFTIGGPLTAGLRRRAEKQGGHAALATGAILQLAISVYGGYFGGGMGILMLAVFALEGMTNIHAMNGLKNLLGVMINGVAVIAFAIAGAVAWGPAAVMIVGAIAGGYGGASVARRLDPTLVKRGVMIIAWALTIYFFLKTYLATSA